MTGMLWGGFWWHTACWVRRQDNSPFSVWPAPVPDGIQEIGHMVRRHFGSASVSLDYEQRRVRIELVDGWRCNFGMDKWTEYGETVEDRLEELRSRILRHHDPAVDFNGVNVAIKLHGAGIMSEESVRRIFQNGMRGPTEVGGRKCASVAR